ncbi:MAG TPA: 3-dehydroquinate synthase [Rhodospirillaceae bacterium]|nr:3-dehydroquinate synthase [Rhodospirillaceae bacterium]
MISAIRVLLGDRSYDIHVGQGLLAQAGTLMRPVLSSGSVFVVTDENVEPLHLAKLKDSLDAAGLDHHGVVLPAGEQTKSFAHLEALLDTMLDAGCERHTAVIAFGGGVVGDLAGLAASLLLRGVPLVQIPTTLLSQVDSSVGGKTGINTTQGKNLVGSFYQPRIVLADTDLLETLSPRELRSGYAEVVKYGLIDDPGFFLWLESHGKSLLAGNGRKRKHAVLTSCAAKARVVMADEREHGSRALLNLGHTFGHALEADSGYGELLTHGEAVSIGMLMAFELSRRLGLCPEEDVARLRRHLGQTGLPTALPERADMPWNAERLMEHFIRDKKVRDGKAVFVLARGIGKAFLSAEVPEDVLLAMLREATGEAAAAGTPGAGGAA